MLAAIPFSINCLWRRWARASADAVRKADALTFGIAHAAGELVVCVDGDSMLEPDALRRLAVHFSEPRMGAVAGCVRVINRDTLWTKLQALEYVVGLADYGKLIKQEDKKLRANLPPDVAQGAAVFLTVSTGPQPVAVPFVVGKTLAQANALLTSIASLRVA